MHKAVITYLPIGVKNINSVAFHENLTGLKTENSLITFSDNKAIKADFKIDSPEPLKQSPNKVAINNYLFLEALKIAKRNGIGRFIYLESDCRMAVDYWDGWVFDEVDDNSIMTMAGTPAIWNYKRMSYSRRSAVDKYAEEYMCLTGLPVAHFHPKRATTTLSRDENASTFIIGAGAVYDTESVCGLFEGFDGSTGKYSTRIPAFDQWIGIKLYQLFGDLALNRMPFITKIFSGYKDNVATQEERIAMVKYKRFCLVHQIKCNSNCLFK